MEVQTVVQTDCKCNETYICIRCERDAKVARQRAHEIAEYYWNGLVVIQEHHSMVQHSMIGMRNRNAVIDTNCAIRRITEAIYRNWLAWAKAS